jgi:hypothetical protein
VNPDDIPTEITRLTYSAPPVDKNHNGTPLHLSQNRAAEQIAHYWPAIEKHVREQVAGEIEAAIRTWEGMSALVEARNETLAKAARIARDGTKETRP